MSVLDVMNYVRSTPRNTNPAVIASMVENEQRTAIHEEVVGLQEVGAIGGIEWAPFVSFTKQQLGIEDYEQFWGLIGYSASQLLTRGQFMRAKIGDIITEGQVLEMDVGGMPALVALNNFEQIWGSYPGDWGLADIDGTSVFGTPFHLVCCVARTDSAVQQLEFFNSFQKGIHPQYISDNVLIKQNNKKVMEVSCTLEDGGLFLGPCEQFLQPGKRYLISDGQKTTEITCNIFPRIMEDSDEPAFFTIYCGNPALFDQDGPFGDLDTGEDFLYVNSMNSSLFTTTNMFFTLEPKTLVIEEVGYSSDFNYENFKGKMGFESMGEKSFMAFSDHYPDHICRIKNYTGTLYKHPAAPFNPYEITKIKWRALLAGGESKPIVHECVDKNGAQYYAVGCERNPDLIDSLIYISYSPFILNTSEGEKTLEAGVYVADLDGWRMVEAFKIDTIDNKIDPKYLPEGLGHSKFEPEKLFVYTGLPSDYQHESLQDMRYYIKANLDIASLFAIQALKIKNLFGEIQTLPISNFQWTEWSDKDGKNYSALVPIYNDDFSGHAAIILTSQQITIDGSYGQVTLTPGIWIYQNHNDDFTIRELLGETKENVYPIPQKYIPALDSIVLNGADGKQYSLTVDANGQLSVKLI